MSKRWRYCPAKDNYIIMKKESEYVGLFIINGASVDKRKSLPAMTENPDSSRFKVGSDVKMTTVSSKTAPK